ncbi:hypothetical protein C8R44DRAFT_876678 [Mycena epipterygia]|nr:hypothetical protein C8R44DRAFT_876678 [Mycena epipterygia]
MKSHSPTPSASSHASSLVRAILRTPTVSPANRPTADTSASYSQAIVADITTPRSVPVYHLYGLDSSTIGDSVFAEDTAEPTSSRLEPIALFIPVSARFSQGLGLDAKPQIIDVFGPVRYHPTSMRDHAQRCSDAALAARLKNVRTAAWHTRFCGPPSPAIFSFKPPPIGASLACVGGALATLAPSITVSLPCTGGSPAALASSITVSLPCAGGTSAPPAFAALFFFSCSSGLLLSSSTFLLLCDRENSSQLIMSFAAVSEQGPGLHECYGQVFPE